MPSPTARPPALVSFGEGLRELWTPTPAQIPALDVLRSAAIVLVIVGHFAVLGGEVFPHSAAVFRTPPFRFGWTGVDLFFVLSGLLIGRQLWREYVRSGTVDVRRFILRRGFRIWPLYFAAVLLSPVLTATWSYRWADWLFISNYLPCRVEGGWSLSTEEQFYMLAPVLLVLGARRFRARRWFVLLPLGLAGVSVVRWLTARRLLAAGMSAYDVKQALFLPFHLHNEGLAVGLLIALAATVAPEWISGARAHRRRTAALVVGALGLGAALDVASPVVFPFLALALIFGAVTVALLAAGPVLPAIVRARAFFTVSRLSYGMYLNHRAIMRWIAPPVVRGLRGGLGEHPTTIALALLFALACSAAVAAVTFVLVERPFLLLRERMLHARPALGARAGEVVPA
ncbi:acyltransferase [Gemmatimonadetes bacterium T265]|nr:acyltransferase [Gemmatimonadetes bacterium T265]